jgi:superfamily II DNA or RNA helicase
MPVLRPYQEAAVGNIVGLVNSGLSPVVAAPTGSGKTVMGVAAVMRLSRRALWIAHRRELIHQAAEAVREAGGHVGLILAGEPRNDEAPIQIASVQTLARRSIPDCDLLVIDEAHHATGPSYKAVIGAFKRRFGLTATPFRLDGKGLGEAGFDEIVTAAFCDDLCATGVLHKPRVFAGASANLDGVHKTAGDFNLGELGTAVRTAALQGQIVSNWQRLAKGKRTVCFCVDLAHADQVQTAFREAGVFVETVDGKTPKIARASALARLAAGLTEVLINVGVLTEGWDLPSLECAIAARPTSSLCLHLQMLGRVMRACPGKEGALVLDHAGNTHRHGFVTDRHEYSLESRVGRSAGMGEGEAAAKTCRECQAVVPVGCLSCPECGAVLVEKVAPSETEEDLVEITARQKRAEETIEQRRTFWRRTWWGQNQKHASEQGSLWDLNHDTEKADSISSAIYHARYGEYPIFIGEALFERGNVPQNALASMRSRWRKLGEKKGWPPAKIAWFVNKCTLDANTKRIEVTA